MTKGWLGGAIVALAASVGLVFAYVLFSGVGTASPATAVVRVVVSACPHATSTGSAKAGVGAYLWEGNNGWSRSPAAFGSLRTPPHGDAVLHLAPGEYAFKASFGELGGNYVQEGEVALLTARQRCLPGGTPDPLGYRVSYKVLNG